MELFSWEKNNAESLSGYEVEALSGLPPEWQEIPGGSLWGYGIFAWNKHGISLW